VRSKRRWNNLSNEQREELKGLGWEAPRFENEEGAGLDILFMHREMIKWLTIIYIIYMIQIHKSRRMGSHSL
tara:strand:- start:5762 stop:5977 length:216 start_codon:yes stop_codon:yes gene_type:complete